VIALGALGREKEIHPLLTRTFKDEYPPSIDLFHNIFEIFLNSKMFKEARAYRIIMNAKKVEGNERTRHLMTDLRFREMQKDAKLDRKRRTLERRARDLRKAVRKGSVKLVSKFVEF